MDGSGVCITLGAQMSAWRPLRPPGRRYRTELPVYPVCSTRNTSKLGVLICPTVQSHAQTVCHQGLWEMSADQQPLPSCWELCPCFLQSAIHHQRQSARAAASIEFVPCTEYSVHTPYPPSPFTDGVTMCGAAFPPSSCGVARPFSVPSSLCCVYVCDYGSVRKTL